MNNPSLPAFAGAACCAILMSHSAGAVFTVDFETDDSGNALGNGQIIDDEFSMDFTITSPNTGVSHLGPTIFDSTPGGPNADGNDPDLLVDLGNILILQNTSYSSNDGAFFAEPNDEPSFYPLGYGTIVFDFESPVELLSIDLIDVDKEVFIDVTLTDSGGNTRAYYVPEFWTHDVYLQPDADGYDTLDLTAQHGQVGEGGSKATVAESAGFDPTDVTVLEIRIAGKKGGAGIDNLTFVPGSPTLAAMLVGLAGLSSRRRRR